MKDYLAYERGPERGAILEPEHELCSKNFERDADLKRFYMFCLLGLWL